MTYYGAPPDVCSRVSELLGLAIEDMGEDWEIILADVSLISPAIHILEARTEPWMVRAAIGCILVGSLFESRLDEGASHFMHDAAYTALRMEPEVLNAVTNFWIGGGTRSSYIRDLLLG
ncbi:hypothetical protein [Pseudomonas entomophila]|uniref:hypothetical protein n=1 Tax=Pseudomonas entomophila TaxID=312306 RepID=UPI00200E527F|nr:hypothetical protein [Pseudomonas entomophila]